MTAFGPRLSLAPGLISGRPLALRAAGSSRASEGVGGSRPLTPSGQRLPAGPRKPAPRLSTTGCDRQLDRDRAAASFREGETLLVPDCDRGLNSHRVSLRRSPELLQAHPIEGQETGRERLLPLIERTFARI
jgi:hypothetical protein